MESGRFQTLDGDLATSGVGASRERESVHVRMRDSKELACHETEECGG